MLSLESVVCGSRVLSLEMGSGAGFLDRWGKDLNAFSGKLSTSLKKVSMLFGRL